MFLTCQALQSKPGSKLGELSVLTFRRECMQGLLKIVSKVQEKSPLKFPVVRAIACLDPASMHRDPEWCLTKMKTLVQRFLQDKQLAGGISAGREDIEDWLLYIFHIGPGLFCARSFYFCALDSVRVYCALSNSFLTKYF